MQRSNKTLNKIEKRLAQLKRATAKKPCPYNQFEETMIHAEIIKKEHLLEEWRIFQENAITTPSHLPKDEQFLSSQWNGFKRGTPVKEIYAWFNQSFNIDVYKDLL